MATHIELDEASVAIGMYLPTSTNPPTNLSIITDVPEVQMDPPAPPPPKASCKSTAIFPNKIPEEKLHQLNSLLQNIRINPSSMKDILFTEQIEEGGIHLCEQVGDLSKFMSTFSQYGLSKTRSSQLSGFSPDVLTMNGRAYGQDYCITTADTSALSDGHGEEGERLSHFVSEKLYEGFNSIDFNKLLLEERFKALQFLIQTVFVDLDKQLKDIYDYGGRLYTSKRKALSIRETAGTTCNISKLINVTTEEGTCKRYVITANLGDSETAVILRKPDNTYKIITTAGIHSAENVNEANRLYSSDPGKYKLLQPIYNRFGTHDAYGRETAPIPSELKKHLDGAYILKKKYPIFCMSDMGLTIDRELQHKMLFGSGGYGKLYNISKWCGGIQSLRTFTIEKFHDGGWKEIIPIPSIDNLNMGSSMGGNNQCSRGFEGNTNFNDIEPHISILEIPADSHATVITCSDGYGDTVYWSEIAEAVSKAEYNSRSSENAEIIKSHLVDLLHKNITGLDVQGFTIKQNIGGESETAWDDVSFSIIDSPPII